MRYVRSFADTFQDLLRRYDKSLYEVIQASGCDSAYARRLYHGEKENPSPQTCEQLGFGIGHEETYDNMLEIVNELLLAAGHAPLHVQRRRRKQKTA